MRNIVSFLKKFSRIAPPESAVRVACAECIFESVGIRLSDTEIQVGGGVVHLRTDPATKSEILLRRSDVLRLLRERLPGGKGGSVSDIR